MVELDLVRIRIWELEWGVLVVRVLHNHLVEDLEGIDFSLKGGSDDNNCLVGPP